MVLILIIIFCLSLFANYWATQVFVTQWGGGGGVSFSFKKSVTKVRAYGSIILVLRGGGWGVNSKEKVLRNT